MCGILPSDGSSPHGKFSFLFFCAKEIAHSCWRGMSAWVDNVAISHTTSTFAPKTMRDQSGNVYDIEFDPMPLPQRDHGVLEGAPRSRKLDQLMGLDGVRGSNRKKTEAPHVINPAEPSTLSASDQYGVMKRVSHQSTFNNRTHMQPPTDFDSHRDTAHYDGLNYARPVNAVAWSWRDKLTKEQRFSTDGAAAKPPSHVRPTPTLSKKRTEAKPRTPYAVSTRAEAKVVARPCVMATNRNMASTHSAAPHRVASTAALREGTDSRAVECGRLERTAPRTGNPYASAEHAPSAPRTGAPDFYRRRDAATLQGRGLFGAASSVASLLLHSSHDHLASDAATLGSIVRSVFSAVTRGPIAASHAPSTRLELPMVAPRNAAAALVSGKRIAPSFDEHHLTAPRPAIGPDRPVCDATQAVAHTPLLGGADAIAHAGDDKDVTDQCANSTAPISAKAANVGVENHVLPARAHGVAQNPSAGRLSDTSMGAVANVVPGNSVSGTLLVDNVHSAHSTERSRVDRRAPHVSSTLDERHDRSDLLGHAMTHGVGAPDNDSGARIAL